MRSAGVNVMRRAITLVVTFALAFGISGCGLMRARTDAPAVIDADVVERDLSQPYERAQ